MASPLSRSIDGLLRVPDQVLRGGDPPRPVLKPSIGAIILLFPLLLSAMLLRRRMPLLYAEAPSELRGVWLSIIPGASMVFGLFFVVALVAESPTAGALLAVWMVAGIFFYRFRRRYVKQGERLE